MKAPKRAILIVSIVIIGLVTFSSFTYASGRYKTTENLNLRTGNTTSYNIMALMPRGSILEHLKTMDNGWFKVNYNGKVGYASREYLIVASDNNEDLKKETLYFISQDLDLREERSIQAKKLLTIPKGTHLQYIESNGDWHKIKYKDKIGYVESKYVKEGSGYKSKGILVVNKGYRLSSNFNPGINPQALDALKQMIAQAKEEEIKISAFSDFRTYSYQEKVYNRYVKKNGKEAADTYSARPGHSEHQTGLAFDICGSSPDFSDGFAQTKEGTWIAGNAHKFGFIISYPKGKDSITGYKYEPWHIRYIGRELSSKIKDSGLTLDEYLGTVKANY